MRGGGASPWYPGLPASGNHVLTYGLALADEPLALTVGETADLFEGGTKDAPEGVEVSYSYAAGPLSVDAGTVTAKAPGASEVAVTLTLDGIELARASRLIQVKRGETATAPEGSPVVRATVPLLAQTLSASADNAGISTLAATGVGVGKYFTATVSGRRFKCTVLTEDLEAATGTVKVENGETSTVNITNLTIPPSVTYNDVTYTVTEIASLAYYKSSTSAKHHDGTLTIPDTVTKIGRQAFYKTGFSGDIVIPDSVTEIDDEAFGTMKSMTSVTLPKGLTEIGVNMFYNDIALASVTFPENLVTIGDAAFRECLSLAGSITIPSGVTSIGNNAFGSCSALTSVSLPDSLISLGSTAFSGCSNLESAPLPASLESIGNQAFMKCTKLKGSAIPPKIKSIGSWVFGNCPAFTTPVILPSTLESLGANAFNGTTGVTAVLDCSAADLGATPFAAGVTVYCPTSRASTWTGTHNGTIVPCTSSISKSSETLVKSDATLTATFTGLADSSFASSAKVEWASEDASIVSVMAGSNGQATISPVANGKKKVTATQTVDGVPFMSESCEVTVERYKTVTFDTGEGGSAVDALEVETGDKATKPDPAPERTGYTFVDWYAALTDEKPFDFKNTAIESDITLYAKWALVISYDAPADATVSVDADGTTSVSSVTFKSKAAAPVEIVAVASTAQEGLAQLFPDETSRGNLKLSVAPPGGTAVSFPLTAPADALTSNFLKGKGFTMEANGSIELSYSLVIPSGTRMNYLGDAADGTPLASIEYKLAAVEEGAGA